RRRRRRVGSAAIGPGLRKAGEVERRLEAVGNAPLVVRGQRLVRADAGRQVVQSRRVEPQDLALHLLVQRRVAVLARHVLRDLEAPEGLDLPLRRAVPQGVGAEYHALRPHVLEELPQHVRAHAREGDHAGGEAGADLGVHVLERRRKLRNGVPDLRLLTEFAQLSAPLKNVYAEIGTSFASCVVTFPSVCAHMLGQLLKYMGPERVVFGSDSLWYGAPQWQIEAFWRFQ